MNRFENQVAVITGGAKGIGKGVARRLAKAGCHIAIIDLHPQMTPETVKEIKEAYPVEVRGYVCDLTDWDQVVRTAGQIESDFGRVDILINNAGWACLGAPIVQQSNEVWEKSLLVNVSTQFYCCKAFVPQMVNRGYGRIVNLSSMAGKEGNPNLTPYSAAKSAVIGLTKALGKELATTGVLVNCICPAVINTEMAAEVGLETQNALIAKIPMGRMGEVEEVAALIEFLSSKDMSFSTGAVFDISGGRATY